MEKTLGQYDKVLAKCQHLFQQKLKDYGSAWRILRLPSLTDQIYIKANRIRTLQEKQEAKVAESEASEFVGIINYSAMALIQLEKGVAEQPDLSFSQAVGAYEKQIETARSLMILKNHDYGEAWRDMRIASITDLILQKLLRVKQIEDNAGELLVSEGLDANYLDMLNYAAFALILINEKKNHAT